MYVPLAYMHCISIYGYNISIYGHRKLRQRDIAKFHTQLSAAMLGAFVVLLVGSERVEVDAVCTVMSLLIQYFSLAAVLWMGAEAVLMFHKLVIVMKLITTKHIIVASLICWRKTRTDSHNIILL